MWNGGTSSNTFDGGSILLSKFAHEVVGMSPLQTAFPFPPFLQKLLLLALVLIPVGAAAQAQFSAPPMANVVMPTDSGDGWILKKQVNEVAVMFTAKLKGRFVDDLAVRDIEVREDKRDAGKIVDFRNEANLPLRLALLIDTSGSVDQRFEYEQQAAKKFVDKVIARPADEAFIMGFSQKQRMAQNFTSDAGQLGRAISSLHDDRGATAVFDAVAVASRQLASHPDPDRVARVLVLVTDGDDNSSKMALEAALAQAQDNEVTIYALSTTPSNWDAHANEVMRTLAERTGGRVFFPESKREFSKAFAQIGDDLRNRYAIAYRPLHFEADGRFHKIRITAKRFGKKLHIHARPGYYARAPLAEPEPSPQLAR
jgi:Ca-activated chloride channel homolog